MSQARPKRHYRTMTVANIRERAGADSVEVLFLDSPRFYKLSRTHPSFDDAMRQLRDAAATGQTVNVGLASIDSDVIEDVEDG